jgi:hypothetical protein
MYKRNISWEPVLHKNYKECITEISPGNQYFIKTIKECITEISPGNQYFHPHVTG